MSGWFARVGLPLSRDEQAAVGGLIDSVAPQASGEVTLLTSWQDALQFLRACELDPTGWDQEEREREWLWTRVAELQTESTLLQAMAALQARLDAQVRAALFAAGAKDSVVISEAMGSSLLAAQQSALAELAGELPDHRFRRKFALFESGRWPLGYHAARFVLF